MNQAVATGLLLEQMPSEAGRFTATTAGTGSLYAEVLREPGLRWALPGAGSWRWVLFVAHTDTSGAALATACAPATPGPGEDVEDDVFLPRLPLRRWRVSLSVIAGRAPEPRLVGGSETLVD